MINQNNPIFANFSGKFGDLFVVRRLRGKTILSKMPRKRDRSLETDAQRATYDRMRQAGRYAAEVLQNPEKKEFYRILAKRQKLPNARTAAVTDYLRNGDPRIENEKSVDILRRAQEATSHFPEGDEFIKSQNNIDKLE
jgi:hypothetical protein